MLVLWYLVLGKKNWGWYLVLGMGNKVGTWYSGRKKMGLVPGIRGEIGFGTGTRGKKWGWYSVLLKSAEYQHPDPCTVCKNLTVGCKRAVRNQDFGFHFTFRPQVFFFDPRFLLYLPSKSPNKDETRTIRKPLLWRLKLICHMPLSSPGKRTLGKNRFLYMFLWLVLALGSNSPAVLFWARSRILCKQQDHPFDWAPLKEQEGLNWRWKQCCHFLSKQMHLLSRPSRSFRGAQSKRWFCCLNSTLDRAQKSTAGELEPSARISHKKKHVQKSIFP